MLLAPKPAPQAPSPSESRKGFALGSATLVLAGDTGTHGLQGYSTLPDWVEPGKEPDPRLREDGRGNGPTSSQYESRKSSAAPASDMLDEAARAAPMKSNGLGEPAKPKTLDDWLAEEEESEETEEDTDEEEEEEEDDDEDDDDDDEEEDESSDDGGEADRLVKS